MTIKCDVDGRIAEISDTPSPANFPEACFHRPVHAICDLHAQFERGKAVCPVCISQGNIEEL
jgi:hypothetical protein